MNRIPIKTYIEIFIVATKLGLTSFGGPIAHLGYFHEEYVRKRKWIDEKRYAELVALCQFLPGPASSQVGIGIGSMRAGVVGGVISFLGFTLPSVIALILFAISLQAFDISNSGWIHGLKIVAVAVVAHAIIGMAKNLTPDHKTKSVALGALICVLLMNSPITQIAIIFGAAMIGFFVFKGSASDEEQFNSIPVSKTFAVGCLLVFGGLLVFLPFLTTAFPTSWLEIFKSFYQSGAFVFGGGHVVLPLLEKEFVPSALLSKDVFLAGYGAAQAVPGPLFTFAAFIGATLSGWKGGLFATFAIFLPAFLLVFGFLPFWDIVRKNKRLKGMLIGVNAAVVGILIAAFYDPIWKSSIFTSVDFSLAAVLFSMLAFWKAPPWCVVIFGAISGYYLQFI